MLCPHCRRQVTRGGSFCGSCGAPLGAADAPLELVLAGGDRIPLVEDLLIYPGPADLASGTCPEYDPSMFDDPTLYGVSLLGALQDVFGDAELLERGAHQSDRLARRLPA